jgi:hypothetical protein
MQAQPYSYEQVLSVSERVAFQLDDVLPPGAHFDFSRAFLPDSLVGAEALRFLGPSQQRCLNQIRSHAYLCMFGIVEEFILPFVLDHARGELSADDARTRALLTFASEEAKHIDLFRRFRARFERDFGTQCDVVGPAQAVAKSILAHGPLAVALTILHIEWMTQRHYLESVKRDQLLDPQFGSLLKHHFLEECQHAKLDTLMVLELARGMKPAEIAQSVAEYLSILVAFDELLAQQAELDIRSFERASGRVLSASEWQEARLSQWSSARFTFLTSGMSHPNFVATLNMLGAEAAASVQQAIQRFQGSQVA